MTLRGPRRLVHRGVVEARGVLIAAVARGRVLDLWARGCTVLSVDSGLVLLWPDARRIDCAAAPGVALVRIDRALAAAPWSPAELRAIGATERHCVLLAGDVATLLDIDRAPRVDPAEWIDLGDLALAPVESLGEAPESLPVHEARGVREVLTGEPRVVRPEWKEIAAALHTTPPDGATGGDDGSRGVALSLRDEGRGRNDWLARWLADVSATLARWARTQRGRGLAVVPSLRPRRHWLDRVGDWLDAAAERMRLQRGLRALLGARNAAYLEGIITKLEGGDVEEALLRAIPLGGGGGGDGEIAWRLPQRDGLKLTVGGGETSAVMPIGESLHERLRRIYRETAARLSAAGRVEQAVFVLAELLGDTRAAVDLLVEHKRYATAAELSEAASLDASLTARLYALAERLPDALRVLRLAPARTHETVLRALRTEQPTVADALTLAWAEHLHATGDPLGAEALARGLTDARPQALGWLLEALSRDGPSRAQVACALLRHYPEAAEAALGVTAELCDRDDALGPPDRLALASELTSGACMPAMVPAARALVAALVRDGGDTPTEGLAQRTDGLVALLQDASLRADMPPRAIKRAAARAEVRTEVPAHRVGSRPVYDVIRLPDGRTLAALGDAGIAVFSRAGQPLPTMDVCAHRLVAPSRGAVVMALGRRAGPWAVTRIAMDTGAREAWGELSFEACSPEHDGSAWVVAQSARLVALDVLRASPSVLRTSRRLDGGVERLAAAGGRAAAVVRTRRTLELLVCDAPALTGLRRQPMPDLADKGRYVITADGRAAVAMSPQRALGPLLLVASEGRENSTVVRGVAGELVSLAATESAAVVGCAAEGLAGVRVVSTTALTAPRKAGVAPQAPEELCAIDLMGASGCGVRALGSHVACWDELGRVVVWSAALRAVVLDACV